MPSRIVLPALMLAVAACASNEPPAQNAAETANVPELQGRAIGEPVSCINSRDITRTHAVTDQVVLFYMRGNRVYRSDLPRTCPRFSRPGTAFTHRTTIERLCDIDVVDLFDPVSGISYGSCQLGKFTPYELPKNARR